MALRVLLADNSEAIKKVIQLSLQDFAAEVRSVSVGVDVMDVARQFKPDIIFADILLQKRSGYEVCLDLKTDPELGSIPVILMWSGFMEMDQRKMQDAKADATLEKPFESNDLRELVKRFVPKLATNPMSDFLNVPGFAKQDIPITPPPASMMSPPPIMPAAAAPAAAPTPPPPPVFSAPPQPAIVAAATPAASNAAPPPLTEAETKSWDMDAFDDINQFEVNETAKSLPDLQSTEASADGDDDFAQKPLNQVSKDMTSSASSAKGGFELDVPDETDFDGVTVEFRVPDDVTNTDFLNHPAAHAVVPPAAHASSATGPTAATPPPLAAAPAAPAISAPAPATPIPQLTEQQMEDILMGQSREIIEKIVWKLVPDMAERIIRDEIKRLLDEPDMKA